jgi:cell division protein ZapA (FtsZ GTPase activity inhibitor)
LITIELFGQPYTFKADTEADTAREIAELLSQEVAKVQEKEGGKASYIPKLTIMILAALNIAHHAVQLKKDHGEFANRINEHCERLVSMLDEGFDANRALRQWG